MKAVQAELKYWLAISQLAGVGPKRFSQLLQRSPDLDQYFDGEQPTKEFQLICQQLGVTAPLSFDWKKVNEALAWAERPGCHIVHGASPFYPPRLKEISSAPPILYVKGEPTLLACPQLAVVGSRRPTEPGRQTAYAFAKELAAQGITITSGMALGVDAAAHEGALDAGGKTIAVLGHGLNTIYPSGHRLLSERIAEQGALVTEFALDVGPVPAHFPRRNRIISGLAHGVLVVECSLKSGSLITARYALEQDREVFAIPSSIHNPLAKGCHELIRQGAKCVDDIRHILEEFPSSLQQIATNHTSYVETKMPRLGQGDGNNLLSHVSIHTTAIDTLIANSGLTAEQVSSMLIELELQGVIACVPGGYVRITKDGTL